MKSLLRRYREWQEARKEDKEFTLMAQAYYTNFVHLTIPHQMEISAFSQYLRNKEKGEIAEHLDPRRWRRHLLRVA